MTDSELHEIEFHDVISGVPEVVDEVVQITSSVFNEK